MFNWSTVKSYHESEIWRTRFISIIYGIYTIYTAAYYPYYITQNGNKHIWYVKVGRTSLLHKFYIRVYKIIIKCDSCNRDS